MTRHFLSLAASLFVDAAILLAVDARPVRDLTIWGQPRCNACIQARELGGEYRGDPEKHPRWVRDLAADIGYPIVSWRVGDERLRLPSAWPGVERARRIIEHSRTKNL